MGKPKFTNIEAKKMGDRQYVGFVTLPTLLVAIAGILYAGTNIIEAGIDTFEGDWNDVSGNLLEAYAAAFLSAAVGKSALDAVDAR